MLELPAGLKRLTVSGGAHNALPALPHGLVHLCISHGDQLVALLSALPESLQSLCVDTLPRLQQVCFIFNGTVRD